MREEEIQYEGYALSRNIFVLLAISAEALLAPWKSLWRPMTFECLQEPLKNVTHCGRGMPQQFDYGYMAFCLSVILSAISIALYFKLRKRPFFWLFLSFQTAVFLLGASEFLYVSLVGGIGDG